MRKLIDIENLLSWAFVHELPKGGGVDGIAGMNSAWRKIEASSWGKIMSFAELGTLIDRGAREPAMWIEQGEPHRDAVLVGEAVAALNGVEIGGFGDWEPFADRPDLAPHLADMGDRVERRMKALPAASRARLPVTLVISAAVTGRGPDWQWPEEPRLRMVERGGRPAWFVKVRRTHAPTRAEEWIEVDGYDPVKRRQKPGAYRKYEVAPDAFGVALSRADWQIWVACLGMLVEELRGALADWEVVPSVQSLTPWVDGVPARPLRILEASIS